jgi:hypothetical protein
MQRTLQPPNRPIVFFNFVAAAVWSWGQATYAQDLRFDQQQADMANTLRELTWEARLCMRDASQTMLRLGNRDSGQIVLFAKKTCGNGVVFLLTGQGQQSAQTADAYLETLAYAELRRIPGLEYRPAPNAQSEPKAETPKASHQAEGREVEGYVVALGAFVNPERVILKLKSAGIPHYAEARGANHVGLRAGPFNSKQAAEAVRPQLRQLGFVPGEVRRRNGNRQD